MKLAMPKPSTINTIYGVMGLLSATIGLAEHFHKYYAAHKTRTRHKEFGFHP